MTLYIVCNIVAIKSKSIEVQSNFLAARPQGQAHSVNLDIENYSLWENKKTHKPEDQRRHWLWKCKKINVINIILDNFNQDQKPQKSKIFIFVFIRFKVWSNYAACYHIFLFIHFFNSAFVFSTPMDMPLYSLSLAISGFRCSSMRIRNKICTNRGSWEFRSSHAVLLCQLQFKSMISTTQNLNLNLKW